MEELLKSALSRVKAPSEVRFRMPEPQPRRSWLSYAIPVCAVALIAAFAVYLRPSEMDIQPYLQQSPDFVKTVHGESVRHVVMNDVDLFIASPKLHMHGGNSRWIQFPCSKQVCLAACKRCSQATLEAVMTNLAPK